MIKTIKTNQENVKLTIFSSTEDSFLVTSTLVEKDGHALLINAKFTQSDAFVISDYITQNNLILDKIFTLHGDPDYYFGLKTIKASHPHAIAYSTKDSVEHIVHSVLGKLSGSDPNVWSTFYMIFLLISSNSTGVKYPIFS